MKSLVGLCICMGLWVSYVESDKYKLIDFFKKLKNHDDIISKKVLVGGRGISINDYFKVRRAKLMEVNNSKPITTKNVNEISKLLYIVLSCEYTNYIQYFITKLDEHVDKCYSLKKNKLLDIFAKTRECFRSKTIPDNMNCYQSIKTDLCDHFLNNMSQMIQTLLGLQKLTKHFVSKKQDALKKILTLYAELIRITFEDSFTVVDKETFSNKLYLMKTMNFQIGSYFERFKVIY